MKLPVKQILSKNRKHYQIADREGNIIVTDVIDLGDTLNIEEAINNYPKAIELLKKAKECIYDLTSLADGYENDYLEIHNFLNEIYV